ncbi:MAG TPA: hypothetical protein V6D10_05835 [Trichocoleus sp.]
MSVFEQAAWCILIAFCLHQLRIADVPKFLEPYGVRIEDQRNGSQQATGGFSESTDRPVEGTQPNPERIEGREPQVQGKQ